MHVHNDNGDWWFDVHNVNVMFTMMFTMMVLVIGGMVKLYCDFSSTDLKAKEKFPKKVLVSEEGLKDNVSDL